MYFNTNNNFYHGIMFHHFHDDKLHLKGQGSISGDELYKLIKFIGRNNILAADVFFEKLKQNKLKPNEVCLTFDDAIKCQIDIALPVLEDLNIKGFFFVYTSVFEAKPDLLEVFRYFRTNFFNNIEEFYTTFYKVLDKDLTTFFQRNAETLTRIKKKMPFYTMEDIKFRLVRDQYLTKAAYIKIMFVLMKEKKVEPQEYYDRLFFNKNDLKTLASLGHLVGLHSHTHPTLLEKSAYDEQKAEYQNCISMIANILGTSQAAIKFMSHPCGSYNQHTLEILKELGIELGFKHTMDIEPEKGMHSINESCLQIARANHAEIIKRMQP